MQIAGDALKRVISVQREVNCPSSACELVQQPRQHGGAGASMKVHVTRWIDREFVKGDVYRVDLLV